MNGDPLPTPAGQEVLEASILGVIADHFAAEPFGAPLRARVASRNNLCRRLSGCGFFLEFQVDRSNSLRPAPSPLPDELVVKVGEDSFQGGCIYFWSDDVDKPDMLEVYPHYGDWPDDVSKFRLAWSENFRRLGSVEETIH